MAKLVDPDSLVRNTEIVFDTTAKTIQLLVAGNLDDLAPGKTSGVTEQAVYSKCKELWRSETDLNKLKFPLKAITEVKMDLINTWNWEDAQTKDLIRDGGWALRSGSANVLSQSYMNITTLGDFDSGSDLAYIQQAINAPTTSIDKAGEVNEPILIYASASSGEPLIDYRDYFKMFLREQAKLYAISDLVTEQEISSLDYTVYKVPLANSTDIKITAADDTITGSAPYISMSIDYLSGSNYNSYVSGTTHPQWDVVFSESLRWYRVSSSNPDSGGEDPSESAAVGGTGIWEAFPGERLIGSNYYAYDRIVEAWTGSVEEVYEFTQLELRTGSNINDDINFDEYGYVTGSTADQLCSFLGDTLQTKAGVYVDNIDPNDINSIQLFDITVDFSGSTTTARTFPFVSAGTMVYNTILVNDPSSSYKMYFTNNDAGDDDGSDYDTVNAILVEDNDNFEITGSVPTSDIQFTYDYDFNIQRGTDSSGSNAPVTIVALGLASAEWIDAAFTITRNTGLSFPVNAAEERNYSNP